MPEPSTRTGAIDIRPAAVALGYFGRWKKPNRRSGHIRMNARPMIAFFLIGPRVRLSDEFPRLSPMTKYVPSGIVNGPYELVARFDVRYGSFNVSSFPSRLRMGNTSLV